MARILTLLERLALPAGVVALVAIALHVGWEEVLRDLGRLGGWLPAIFAVRLVSALGFTGSLWSVLAETSPGGVAYGRLFVARLAGEAVSATAPFAAVGGELVKLSLILRWVPLEVAAKGVAVAFASHALAQLIFAALFLPLALPRLDLPVASQVGLGVGVAGLLVGCWVFSRLVRRGQLDLLRALARERRLREAVAATFASTPGAEAVSDRAFTGATLFSFVAWTAGALEVGLILHALGEPWSISLCLAIESLCVFVDALFFFVPGQLGAREGGLAAATRAMGLAPSLGVSIALARRARQLLWILPGLACLAVLRRDGGRRSPAS